MVSYDHDDISRIRQVHEYITVDFFVSTVDIQGDPFNERPFSKKK